MIPRALVVVACLWMSVPVLAAGVAEAGAIEGIKRYNDAVEADDIDRIRATINITSDIQKRAFDLMAEITRSGGKLYQGVLKRFGKEALERDGVARTSFPSPFPKLPDGEKNVAISGSQATLIDTDGQRMLMKLVKVGDQWKIDDGVFPMFTEAELARQKKILQTVNTQIDQTADDVNAGHFRTPEEVILIMEHRVDKAVRVAESEAAELNATTQPTEPKQ